MLAALWSWYRKTAVVVLLATLLFALLNAAAWIALRRARGDARFQDPRRLAAAYPEVAASDLPRFLAEVSRLKRWEYEPFTEFRQEPISGRWANVSSHGYREVKDQAPWPPAPGLRHVFVFGGSTALGVGVGDDGAIPSHLQEALRAALPGQPLAVWNWARARYFSVQERILFEELLVSGLKPSIAVFVDGLNETINLDTGLPPHRWRSAMSPALQAFQRRSAGGLATWEGIAAGLPLSRLLQRAALERGSRERIAASLSARAEQGGAIVARWRRNASLLSASSVPVLFVWQPVPVYGYDLGHHLFGEDLPERMAPTRLVYERMAALRQRGELPGNLLWLADLARDRRENLYVDDLHYTSAFARDIAREIAGALVPLLR